MYCKKCGKFIGTGSEICDDCKQNGTVVNTTVQVQPQVQPDNSRQNTEYYQASTVTQDTSAIKLGKAIAAMILATVGFIFIYVGVVVGVLAGIAVAAIIGLAPTILGFVFGLQSISNFKRTSHIRSGKRIPVLILGIASVVNAGTGMFVALVLVMLAGAM